MPQVLSHANVAKSIYKVSREAEEKQAQSFSLVTFFSDTDLCSILFHI